LVQASLSSESSPRVARLEQVLAERPAGSLPHVLARAELAAQTGEHAAAISTLHDVLGSHWSELQANHHLFASAFCVAIAALDFDAAAAMINRRCDTGDWFSVGVEESRHRNADVVRWDIEDRTHCSIRLSYTLPRAEHAEFTVIRLVCTLPLFAAYRSYDGFSTGSLYVNLGDIGYVPGLAFCDSRAEYFLVPDAVFILHKGYANMRPAPGADTISWGQRQPIAFWRGGTSGRPTDPALGWRSLPRARLCQISREHPDILDASITHVAQFPSETEGEIRDAGIMGPFVPATEFGKFKYQVDIDGNTSSWPGLFQKLLTGSPVLKVASPCGYRQWYYDRLRPWTNFVPVSAEMTDLMEKIEWLRHHDDMARRIGENGKALAMSLGYETELRAAGHTIAAATRFFASRPEMEMQFGLEIPTGVRLVEGWTVPRQDGLPTLGHESRLELPRPVAAESYVLTVDVSPFTDAPAPPAQRVTVVVNGEVLHESVLSARAQVRCHVSRLTIDAADKLRITLLHPDAASLASASNPLDDRALSVILHSITLTPASTLAKAGGADAEVLPPDLVRPMRDKIENELFGPDIWLPPEARCGRLRTHWGTVVFADTHRGVLRHGPAEMSPANLVLGESKGTAYLFHIAPDGTRFTVRLLPDRKTPPREPPSRGVASRFQAFRLVPTGANEPATFGLGSKGLLLCAEHDDRVTLSRSSLGPWERFQLVELA
jgi:hypothetical protein